MTVSFHAVLCGNSPIHIMATSPAGDALFEVECDVDGGICSFADSEIDTLTVDVKQGWMTRGKHYILRGCSMIVLRNAPQSFLEVWTFENGEVLTHEWLDSSGKPMKPQNARRHGRLATYF